MYSVFILVEHVDMLIFGKYHKVQLRLTGLSLDLQVFADKPKY